MHEAEIAHLEQLLEERGPILSIIDKHKSLLEDREQLAISSTDASRLTQRGGQRDPTRLLREEKMRKRIAKDLPKVEADLRNALEQWEEDTGMPFTVRGQNYLQTLPIVNKPPPRSSSRGPASASGGSNLKCPPTPGTQTRGSRSQSVRENRAPQPILKHSASSASTATNGTNISRSNAISRPKTPGASRDESRPKTSLAHRPKTPNSTIRGTPGYTSLAKTPSRNARPALTNTTHDASASERTDRTSTNSDTRSLASYKSAGSIRRKMPPQTPSVSGAPRLGKHVSTSPSQQTLRRGDSMHSRSSREGSVDQSIRCITPPEPSTPGSVYHNRAYLRNGASAYKDSSAEGMSPKQLQQLHPRAFSGTSSESSSTVVSSENWETFEESDDDEDVRTMYLQKLRVNSGPKSPVEYGNYRNFGGALPNTSIAIVGDDEWDDHERN